MKQIIDLRPVYHRLEERIRAHVILCWLALLLIRIETTTTRPGPAPARPPGTQSDPRRDNGAMPSGGLRAWLFVGDGQQWVVGGGGEGHVRRPGALRRGDVVNETGQCDISQVIVACDPEALSLARDHRGHFLVYDEQFNQVRDDDEALDGVRGAISLAEDRHRWPAQRLIDLNDGWESGPDPRQVGAAFYDDSLEETDDDYEGATDETP